MAAKVVSNRASLQEYEAFKALDIPSNDQILERSIDWRQFADAKQINDDDVALLREYDKAPANTQARLLTERGPQYGGMFINAVANVVSQDALEYLLALIDNLLVEDNTRIQYFYAGARGVHPSTPFLRVLTRNSANVFMTAKAAGIAAYILTAPSVHADLPELREYLAWMSQRVSNSKNGELLLAVTPLKIILRNHAAQDAFVSEGGIKSLATALKKETQNTQLLYVIFFCFWLISYNPEVRKQLLENDIMNRLVDLLKITPRKKVVRIAFSALRNLVEYPEFAESMIANGLLKVLPSLSSRKWTDEDLTQDIQVVEDSLQKFVVTLSSFEKYHAELLSGHLEWTPVHSERFWRENIDKFSEDNYSNIRTLTALLDSEDQLTVEVACYDLGEFARFHADGKKLLTRFGAKKKLMEKMSHPSAKVAKQALLTVQKLMINNWESITTASSMAPRSNE